jgi:hypothetical protein
MLHQSPIFTRTAGFGLDGAGDRGSAGGELPASESLKGRLLTLPPLTKVPERFVRECARGLRKVAESGGSGVGPRPVGDREERQGTCRVVARG